MESKKITDTISNFFKTINNGIKGFIEGFTKGDIITKLSYIIMGFGSFGRKQFVKGFFFLIIQIIYILFMVNSGGYYLSMLPTLGTTTQGEVWDEAAQIYRISQGDNSMLLLLFGVSVILVTIVMVFLYVWQTRIAYRNQKLLADNKKLPTFKEDFKDMFDKNFSATILFLPMLLTVLFTVVPLIFMILMAFTNFDKNHQPPGNLFTWVGLENFKSVFGGNPLWATTFKRLFVWTIIWAIFATFLNYILGMLLAIIINKKGIKLKKFWRTIFVITIAVPQFVSLMLMSKLLHDQGAMNVLLKQLGLIGSFIPFLSDPFVAKVTVIVVNIWVGIPYTMLITSGILMNIPEDLYEASKLDGANAFQQFIYITLPYMLHVTTPYLITQFVGNINNFNVIYLLTGGGPLSLKLYQAGETDLLVTWLYKLTVNEQNYALASTIGILIFVIVSTISLIVYNNTSAVKQEDDFS
ncbi:MAG: sugar ABC transporter permease [Bacillota bacterium]|nr:sugar ABC transporter permease [Bacillota bacterium]